MNFFGSILNSLQDREHMVMECNVTCLVGFFVKLNYISSDSKHRNFTTRLLFCRLLGLSVKVRYGSPKIYVNWECEIICPMNFFCEYERWVIKDLYNGGQMKRLAIPFTSTWYLNFLLFLQKRFIESLHDGGSKRIYYFSSLDAWPSLILRK
jgi:hypothetical protein